MALLSSISDIWELGLELTRLAAADIEITEAQREQWTTEERDLVIMRVRHQCISTSGVINNNYTGVTAHRRG